MVKLLSCHVECFDVQWKRQVIFWGNLVTPPPSQHELLGIQFEQNMCNISFTLTHLGNFVPSCTYYWLWNHWYLITVGTIVPVATSLSVDTQPLTLVNCDMMVERWTWNWGRMVRQNCMQSVLQRFIDLIFSSQKTLIFELQFKQIVWCHLLLFCALFYTTTFNHGSNSESTRQTRLAQVGQVSWKMVRPQLSMWGPLVSDHS